jgi:hypothetical protein
VADKVLDKVVELLAGREEKPTKIRVECTLNKSKNKNNRITIPEEKRYLFPAYKARFKIKSDAGEDEVWVRWHSSHKHPHIHLTKTKWFKAHNLKLKDGDKVIIEVRESKSGREYYLV